MLGTKVQSHGAAVRIPTAAAGLGLIGAAVLMVTTVPLHPSIIGDREVAEVVRDTDTWELIHVAMVVGSLLVAFGAAGVVALYEDRLGPLARWGLAATWIGTTVTACIGFVEAVAFPVLAREAPHLLDFDGPILGSWLLRVLAAPAAGFTLGLVAIGLAAARAGVHRRAARSLVATALAFSVFEVLFVPVLGVASTLAFGAVLGWWGWLLTHDGQAGLATPQP